MPALAATIIVAVMGMIDLVTLKQAWGYDRGDAGALLATMAGVLLLGVEAGVVVGGGAVARNAAVALQPTPYRRDRQDPRQ